MFFINAAFAAFASIETFDIFIGFVGGVSKETSLFADIHFIFISLISLFRVFIVSIKYLIMYPDNKIKINTNKSIAASLLRYFVLLKEGYKNNMKMYVAVAASAASLSRPDEIARSINHREYVNDPRIYDDIQFNLVLVDIRDGLPSHQVEQIFELVLLGYILATVVVPSIINI